MQAPANPGAAAPEATPCYISVLSCVAGKSHKTGAPFLATKTWGRGPNGQPRKVDFDAGRAFRLSRHPVCDIHQLSALLTRLESEPRAFVIRGEPGPDVDPRRPVRRKSNPDRNGKIWFREPDRGLPWVMFDFDKVPVPAHLDPAEDPEAAVEYLVGLLPEAFEGVTFHWQLSASAGMGDGGTLSAHLWFWLDRPVTQRELTVWAEQNALPIDTALFRTVQPHYTAAPIFQGLVDPLPRRSGLWPGHTDVVTLPAIDTTPVWQGGTYEGGLAEARGFEAKLARLGDGDGRRGFNQVLPAAIASYVTTHGRAGTDCAALKARLRQAIDTAPKRPGRGADLERYRSDAYLDEAIDSAFARFAPPEKPPIPVGQAVADSQHAPPSRPQLPAYHPAPTETRDRTLARQQQTIEHWYREAERIASFRKTLEARREQAYRAAGVDHATMAERLQLDGGGLDRNPRALPPEVRRTRARLARQVRAEVLETFSYAQAPGPGERLLLVSPMGGGKSTGSNRCVAQITDRSLNVWGLCPTLEKADETAQEYRTFAGPGSLPVVVIRGRGADDPDRSGEKMCPRHKMVNRAAVEGIEVKKAICATCPSAARCGYRRQEQQLAERTGGAYYVMVRDYLFLLGCPAPRPDLVVVDESILDIAASHTAFHPNAITDTGNWRRGGGLDAADEHLTTAYAVHRAVTQHPRAELRALRDAGLTREQIWAAVAYLNKACEESIEGINGRMSDHEIEDRLDALKRSELRHVAHLFRQIGREWQAHRPGLNTVVFRPAAKIKVDGRTETQPRVSVFYQKTPILAESVPVLALDGTGSLLFNRKVFGERMRLVRIAIERQATVTGTVGKSYSRQSITGCNQKGDPIPTRTAAAERLRREIAGLVAEHPAPAGMKFVAASLKAETALKPVLPAETRTGHYGRLRGVNSYETCVAAWIVGAEAVSVEAVENATRPFTATDDESFLSVADFEPLPECPAYQRYWPCWQTRGRRMRDGSVSYVEVPVHPDLRCQEMLEQIREAAVIQAADRVRAIFNRREIVLMNTLVLDVTYDRVLRHAELIQGGSRLERAWRRSRGALPTSRGELSRCFPDLWATPKAAERDPRLNTPEPQIISFLRSGGIYRVRYRRPGSPGRPTPALVWSGHPDPRAALEAVTGPVCHFEIVPPAAPAEPAIAPPVETLAAKTAKLAALAARLEAAKPVERDVRCPLDTAILFELSPALPAAKPQPQSPTRPPRRPGATVMSWSEPAIAALLAQGVDEYVATVGGTSRSTSPALTSRRLEPAAVSRNEPGRAPGGRTGHLLQSSARSLAHERRSDDRCQRSGSAPSAGRTRPLHQHHRPPERPIAHHPRGVPHQSVAGFCLAAGADRPNRSRAGRLAAGAAERAGRLCRSGRQPQLGRRAAVHDPDPDDLQTFRAEQRANGSAAAR